jgi:hypothetical protein
MGSTVKLFAFINGSEGEAFVATVLSELGDFILEHIVWSREEGPHATGVTSENHHDIYREYAKEGGFEIVWKDGVDEEVQAAYAKHAAKAALVAAVEPETITVAELNRRAEVLAHEIIGAVSE